MRLDTKLYKSWMDGVLVDVIFRPPRSFRLSDEAIGRRRRVAIGGVDAWVLAPEDQLLLELASDAEDAPWHWRSALAILAKHEIDWSVVGRPANEESGLAIPSEEATGDARRMLAQGRGVPMDSILVEEVRDQPSGVRLMLGGPGDERYAVDVEGRSHPYHLTRLS